MKKLRIICMALACMLCLSGCGGGGSDGDKTLLEQEIAELQARVAELEEENRALREGGADSNIVSDHVSDGSEAEDTPVEVKLNAMFKLGDVMDMTLTGAEWSDSILPSNTSETYSYYDDEVGETYFVVRGTATSYAGDSIDLQWSSEASVLVNDKYSFSATLEFEDADGKGFGESIKPLQTRNFIIRAAVSDEVYTIAEHVQVDFAIPDNEDEFGRYYDEDHSNGRYKIVFFDLKEA